jgi:coenzyme PQQ biosynthesis protein PqqD
MHEARLRLARKVRLQQDPRTGKTMLLYPERGLELTDTAARIATLCVEPHTVGEIIDAMVAAYSAEPRERIETEVVSFLEALQDRGLLLLGETDAGAEGAG